MLICVEVGGVPVSVKKKLLRMGKHGSISFQSSNSGAAELILLLDCRARACAKGVFFTDTGRTAPGGVGWLTGWPIRRPFGAIAAG